MEEDKVTESPSQNDTAPDAVMVGVDGAVLTVTAIVFDTAVHPVGPVTVQE